MSGGLTPNLYDLVFVIKRLDDDFSIDILFILNCNIT